jgi:hypothetical protein
MPNATVRANARTLPEANRRVVLGGVLAAATLAAIPAGTTEAAPEAEPELQAVIAAWNESHRRLEETYDASCAADERARCPVPQALITTESDAKFWSDIVPGKHFQRKDVDGFRALTSLTYRLDDIFSCDGYDDRAAEIIASWDSWQAEQKAAKEREGVAEADALWAQASGVGHLVEEQKRIDGELEAVAKEACSLGGHSAADVALQAAALLAVEFSSYYAWRAAPKVLQALLEVAGAA